MSKGGKPVNYRSGDRSEALGIPLLQMLCAVAPVPRPEDWGIFDAVATLLSREGGLLYAGDSFMVQFKGRSTPHIDYEERKLGSLLRQELALFAARVDLRESSISLFALGPVIRHPNIADFKKARIHLGPTSKPRNPESEWFFGQTGEPILHWTSAELEDEEFRGRAHDILKKWLEFDIRNRQLKRLGKEILIRWKTNEMPTENGVMSYSVPANDLELLEEIVPSVQVLITKAFGNAELLESMMRITKWMRENGVDPDPENLYTHMSVTEVTRNHVSEVMEKRPTGDVGIAIVPEYMALDGCVFWLSDAQGCGTRISGTLEELREQGYEFELNENGHLTSINLGKRWLARQNFEKIAQDGNVLVLRRILSGE